MYKNYWLLGISVILLLLTSCFKRSYNVDAHILPDGRYDSEYPVRPVSEYLNRIVESVHLVSILAFYESYEYTFSSRLTRTDIQKGIHTARYSGKRYFQKPATGTATVIYYNQKHLALLTCAHIVHFPDTLYSYYNDESGRSTGYIQSIAVKTRQNNHIINIPEANDFEILIMDKELDISIIGKKLTHPVDRPVAVFNYPFGKARDLDWGTLVYLIGCPRGKKMVSASLVSNPDRDRSHSFMVDAAFPRGVSGGIVMALRDGIPNFELVGMINAISAETNYILVPEQKSDINELDVLFPYTGKPYIMQSENMYYGVTYAVSIESIMEFIRKNLSLLRKKGYFQKSVLDGTGIDFITR